MAVSVAAGAFWFLISCSLVVARGASSIQLQEWVQNTQHVLDYISNMGTSLPTWALPSQIQIQENYTFAFYDFMRETHNVCALDGTIFGKNCGMCQFDCEYLRKELGTRLINEPERADVIILGPVLSERKPSDGPGDTYLRVRRLLQLRARPPGYFYVVHKVCARCLPLERDCTRSHAAEDIRNEKISLCRLLFREDFIFADVDLGEHDLDDDHIGDLIRGITLPTGGWSDKHKYRGDFLSLRYSREPRNLLWFRGKCHGGVRSKCVKSPELCSPQQMEASRYHAGKVSKVRLSLAQAFANFSSNQSKVQIEWTSLGGLKKQGDVECPGVALWTAKNDNGGRLTEFKATSTAEGLQSYFEAMLNSWFGFCAHGDERWNLRFLELLSVGTIPFIVADGLTLPYAQIIPWDTLIPRLSESEAETRDPEKILAPLRTIMKTDATGLHPEALRRSATALAIFHTYFSNPLARVRGFLKCAGEIVRKEREDGTKHKGVR